MEFSTENAESDDNESTDFATRIFERLSFMEDSLRISNGEFL